MKKSHLFSLFLALTMLMTTLPVSAEELLIAPAPQGNQGSNWLIEPIRDTADFPDVTDTWCEMAVDTVYRTGLMQGKTSFIVAHRLSTVASLDRIVVLSNGKIVEDGTHAELSRAGGEYERLWDRQTGGFLEGE